MKTPRQIRERFPYMFQGSNIGISISRGWMPVFEQLCKDIDALLGPDKRGFHFTQCKEKFGSARWYWDMKGVKRAIRIDIIGEHGEVTSLNKPKKGAKTDTLSEQIEALIDAATLKTGKACIVCGEPATCSRHDGWVVNLCDFHTKQRRATGKLPDIWFEDEEP